MNLSSAVEFYRVLLAFVALLLCHPALATFIPDWLPEEYRFEVNGSSNEVTEVEETLRLMRDALHPKYLAMMRAAETNELAGIGSTLQWIVHVSQPGVVTNEMVYFNTYKSSYQCVFDRNLLTNRAARLSIVPQRVKLSAVYDDGSPTSVRRLIPGVHYPGVAYEDEGSTPFNVRIALRAPGVRRRLRIRTEASCGTPGLVAFKWSAPSLWTKIQSEKNFAFEIWDALINRNHLSKKTNVLRYLVFAREGHGLWGVPSTVEVRADEFCAHKYDAHEMIDTIDYGDYVDYYEHDEKGRITGLTRKSKDALSCQRFSCDGELITEAYSSGAPKTTRKVRYYIEDNKLRYDVLEDEISHKPSPIGYLPMNI